MAKYKPLTSIQKGKFLAALYQGCSVSKACKESGVSRSNAYYWKEEDAEFADAWEEAKASALETLEDHLRNRALDLEDSKSHILLMFLLRKLDPAYKESSRDAHTSKAPKSAEIEFSKEELDGAIEILEAAKQLPQATTDD